jgi:acyl-CoA synthetase (AMP-forming)/AMP-acid ligase II
VHGLMMDWPLLTPSLIEFAAQHHGGTEIVSRTVEGPIHRYTYREAHARTRQLANALIRLGIKQGDRVATLAWNGYRHLELYYAISGTGAVCHTINPRLFHEQIEYIINHAADRFIFIDLSFVKLLETLQARLTSVEGFVIMTDQAHMPQTRLANTVCYETLIADEAQHSDWPLLDENTAAALCYTSGTTGNPKGTLYSHRAIVLHAFGLCAADSAMALSSCETVLPAVSMFHVHAWGIPYAAAMCGAKLVLPGPKLDGQNLYELIESERVTVTAGVPTVWLSLLAHVGKTGKKLNYLRRINIGGAAAPLSIIKTLEEQYSVMVVHAWGMTEMSPLGTTGRLLPKIAELTSEDRYSFKLKQGRAIYGVELKIIDDAGIALPHDGNSVGHLLARGPWVASAYYEDPEATATAFDEHGWLRTGDVASIDADGHVQLVDRSKDLIKSGGEWISSIDLENTAMTHPGVTEAAAIAVPHEKWGERPLLVVVPREGASISAEEIRAFLKPRVAGWSLPDRIVFVEELPHTATGKVNKRELRGIYAKYPPLTKN